VGEDENDSVSLETLDQTSSGLGQDLWGVYLEEVTGDLMVYGFRSQNFVLRNETRQQDIISIASGGARRVWAYQPGTESSNPLLAWLEKPNLQVMRIQTDANRSIRTGGHGREIRTMDGLSAVQGRGSFFATGAEDTIVRIFAASSQASEGPWGSFKCLRILDKHRSGIQQVSWSKDGRFLFTSAGQEELFVWGISWRPSFDISVKMVAECPKSDPDSEMRITSFDLAEVEESHAGKGFLLCLTLSNSTIRV
jgi:WD40 repeat protein